MGILDSKVRILDTVVTTEGRRQIASGKLKIEFASFSDGGTFYLGDVLSGSDDATNRIFLEARPYSAENQITFETDDNGELISFVSDDYVLASETLYTGSSDKPLTALTSSAQFGSLVDGLLESSIKHFDRLNLIGTKALNIDPSLVGDFNITPSQATFDVTTLKPFRLSTDIVESSLESIEPLFFDKRLTHIDNFQFLPPVYGPTNSEPEGGNLGTYSDLNQDDIISYDDIKSAIDTKDYVEISFDNVEIRKNNIIAQMFEVSDGAFKKLDIIDFGEFVDSDDLTSRHVFFVGKVLLDTLGMPTFVNLFTLVYE